MEDRNALADSAELSAHRDATGSRAKDLGEPTDASGDVAVQGW